MDYLNKDSMNSIKTLALRTAVIIMLFALSTASINAQDLLLPEDKQGKDWSFNVTPYLWFAGLKGNMSVNSINAEVDANFGDILSQFKFGLMLYGEARY